MSGAGGSWRQGLLADLLRSIRIRSSFWYRTELRAPWGFSIAVRSTVFHIVIKGHCWLEVRRLAAPVRLSTGDLVIIRGGHWHALKDAPGTPPVDFLDVVDRHAPDDNGVVRAGGDGAVTKLVCGGMQFENGATDPLLAVLPPLIHVASSDRRSAPRLRLTLEHILD